MCGPARWSTVLLAAPTRSSCLVQHLRVWRGASTPFRLERRRSFARAGRGARRGNSSSRNVCPSSFSSWVSWSWVLTAPWCRWPGGSPPTAGTAQVVRVPRLRCSSGDVGLAGEPSRVARGMKVLGGRWYSPPRPPVDIRSAVSALIAALEDDGTRVRWLSAQALGEVGPEAAPAVPALIRLLGSDDEGSRNSACIGLRGIGPAAKEALPALQRALSDPSPDVRQFARAAIEKIQVPLGSRRPPHSERFSSVASVTHSRAPSQSNPPVQCRSSRP